jgi:hypothetical protein
MCTNATKRSMDLILAIKVQMKVVLIAQCTIKRFPKQSHIVVQNITHFAIIIMQSEVLQQIV